MRGREGDPSWGRGLGGRAVAKAAGSGARSPKKGPQSGAGRQEDMSAVDLARVGACVLKHAVTGEVRPEERRTVGGLLAPAGAPWQWHPGPASGVLRGSWGLRGGAGGADARGRGPAAPLAPPRRPWSCGVCGGSRRAWWLACGASVARCVAGSPRTSAASRGYWTSTACAWWAWDPRPWACRSSWTAAISLEVPVLCLSPPTVARPATLRPSLKLRAQVSSSLPSPQPSRSRISSHFSWVLHLLPLPASPSHDVPPTVHSGRAQG